ncbi:MAG: 50S ribosomal protein L18 [Nitrospirae bacterium]|nr:50S ribosomal protein L18 [Nitrospirota bacterium]
MVIAAKELARGRRHKRIRKKVFGTALKPRLSVFKSLKHIYVQLVDDTTGNTLTSTSTLDKELKGKLKTGGNVESAKKVGEIIAKRAIDKGLKTVVFDRGGYLYHGRVKALADAARKEGLEF